MDVYKFTLCAMKPVTGTEDRIFVRIKVTLDYKNILMFIDNFKFKLGFNDTYDIKCGYETGCLGYSLHNELTAARVKYVIPALTTMPT